jgi:hypothetical protein
MITPNFDKLLQELTADRELVFEFLVVFSRFEYALKRTRHVNGDAKHIDANWGSFAKAINASLFQNPSAQLAEAIDYLSNNPPKKQNYVAGVPDWTDACSGTVDANRLLCLTRAVRNNLFHGGKYPMGPVYDTARDKQLLRHCLVLLNECLKLDQDVYFYFWSFP